MNKQSTVLMLEDGTVFHGKSFGWKGEKTGEVVFNTSLTGYEEILTDPSYCGQIVVMCYPHIGNYGINFDDRESYKIWVEGFIVREYSKIYSNYRAKISLGEFLKQSRATGMEGLDTRALVRNIREKGSMKGIVSTKDTDIRSLRKKLKESPDILGRDLVSVVNSSSRAVYKNYSPALSNCKLQTIVVIDFGTKLSIIRLVEKSGFRVNVLKGKTTFQEIISLKPEGVIFSNGPGDPEAVPYGVKLAKELIAYNKEKYLPVMGICLGHQLLSLGAGAKTFKLKFGHHGGNHPVKELKTGKIEITVQNHNFCVDPRTLPGDFEITHRNLNDGTVEGMKHKRFPVMSFQYHPEASPGPHDSEYIFNRFKELIYAKAKRH